MGKNPKPQTTTEEADDRQLTQRYVIHDPVKGWLRLPNEDAHSIYRGQKLMPGLAGQTVRIVNTHVVLEHKKAQELLRMEPSEWTFDGDGLIDRDALIRDVVKKLDAEYGVPAGVEGSRVALSREDVEAICACLGLKSSF